MNELTKLKRIKIAKMGNKSAQSVKYQVRQQPKNRGLRTN
jgi:hypothetical protein